MSISYVNEVHRQLKAYEGKAKKNKKRILLIAAAGLVNAVFAVKKSFEKFGHSEQQQWLFIGLFVCMFVLPILFIPLNHFLPSQKLNKINIRLKRKLIGRVLRNYNADLRYNAKASIDAYVFFKLGFIKKGLKGAYGDDFLIGSFNQHKVRLSEYHISTFFRSIFDGFVVHVLDSPFINDFVFYEPGFKKHLKREHGMQEKLVPKEIKTNPNIVFAYQQNGALYFGVRGHKDMLDYSFKKMDWNNQKIEKDMKVFESTIKTMDDITKKS